MKIKKFIKLIIATLAVTILGGCSTTSTSTSSTPSSTSSSTQIVVEDMMGREITLDAPATKVIGLSSADCEIIYELGAGDALVGRGEYCFYPEEVLSVPAVSSGMETNVEQIIALQPQVVFMSSMNQSPETVKQIENAGIKVVVSEAFTIEEVYTSINIIGTLLGKQDNAQTLINNMKSTFTDLKNKAQNLEAKTVYFEVSPLQYGLWTAGKDTFMDEIATMIGLENCFGDVSGWAEISEEQVLSRNPDLIVTITMYFGDGPTPTEELLSRSSWKNVTAIKNKAILNLQNDELSVPSYRLAEGAKLLFDFAY